MPRSYDDTAVDLQGTPIHVRQVKRILPSSDAEQAVHKAVVEYAAKVVETGRNLVVSAILSTATWHTNAWFESLFAPEVTDADKMKLTFDDKAHAAELKASVDVVQKTCAWIHTGMSSEHSIKIRELADTSYGYVSTYTGRAGRPQGDIHINRSLLVKQDWKSAVLTYIHEASHKFAQTKDHGNKGYVTAEGKYGERGLTTAQARVNADSYAWFIWMLAPYKLRALPPKAPSV